MSVLRVLSVLSFVCFDMLYCHSHVFAYSINAAGQRSLTHTNTPTHVHVDSPPCTLFPLLAITMTSRFYDFDICFRLLLCMQMTLALMVTQMIVGCCMVTVGAGRGDGALDGCKWPRGVCLWHGKRVFWRTHTTDTHTHSHALLSFV